MKRKKNKKENNKYLNLIKIFLQNYFDNNSIEFEKNIKRDNNKDIYELRLVNELEQSEYLYDINLAPPKNYSYLSNLCIYDNEDYGIFYMDIQLSFSRNSNNLSDCSISVFNVNSFQDRLLFRAEWSNNSNKHAQPHWHFEWNLSENTIGYTSKHDESIKDFSLIKDFQENIEEQENFNSKMKKFHFAMNANWHNEEAKHTIAINKPEELQRWVENSIKYIKEQLEYSFN